MLKKITCAIAVFAISASMIGTVSAASYTSTVYRDSGRELVGSYRTYTKTNLCLKISDAKIGSGTSDTSYMKFGVGKNSLFWGYTETKVNCGYVYSFRNSSIQFRDENSKEEDRNRAFKFYSDYHSLVADVTMYDY